MNAKQLEEERKLRAWQRECARIDKRNAEALLRIKDHDELKKTCINYQDGGVWHDPKLFPNDL